MEPLKEVLSFQEKQSTFLNPTYHYQIAAVIGKMISDKSNNLRNQKKDWIFGWACKLTPSQDGVSTPRGLKA